MEMDPDHCDDQLPSVVPITIKWYDQDLTEIGGDITTDTVQLNCQNKEWSISTPDGMTVRNVIVSTDGNHDALLVFKSLRLDHIGPPDGAVGFPKSWDNMLGLGSFCLSKDDNDFIDSQSLSVRSACQPSIEFYGEQFYYNVFFGCNSIDSSTKDTITLELYDKHGSIIQETQWADDWDTYCTNGSDEWQFRRTGELTFSHHIYEIKLKTSGTDDLYMDTIYLEKAKRSDVGVATPNNKVTWGISDDHDRSFCLWRGEGKKVHGNTRCRRNIRLCVQDCSSEAARTSYEDEQLYRTVVVASDMQHSGTDDEFLLMQYGQSYSTAYFGTKLKPGRKGKTNWAVGRPEYATAQAFGGDALLLDRVFLQRFDIAFPVNGNDGVNTVVHEFLSGNGGDLGEFMCFSTEPADFGVGELGSRRVGNTCLESFRFVFPWSS